MKRKIKVFKFNIPFPFSLVAAMQHSRPSVSAKYATNILTID